VRRILRRKPSPALVIALIALFISMGGVSYGIATGSIDSRELKNNTIRSKDIRNSQVYGKDIRRSTIRSSDVRNNDLTGTDINENSLNIPAAANVVADTAVTAGPLGFARISAAGGVDEAQTKDIADANVTNPSAGRYCFNNLPFDPKVILVTNEFAVQRDAFGTTKPFDHFACPGAEDAAVTVTANNATATNGQFFVVFH